MEQVLFLRTVQPDSKIEIITHQLMRWRGKLKPSQLSEEYEIAIRYNKAKAFPVVLVLKPKLRQRDGEPIPHLYRDGSLCLFRPEKDEWNGKMRISDTILPWASLWIFYYEVWLATGDWLGGGEHAGREVGVLQ